MMSRIAKGAFLGIAAGILGSVASLTPFGLKLEESLGLEILFHLRGHQDASPRSGRRQHRQGIVRQARSFR